MKHVIQETWNKFYYVQCCNEQQSIVAAFVSLHLSLDGLQQRIRICELAWFSLKKTR